MSDVDYNEETSSGPPPEPKKGSYDSRVEQWLFESSEPITITYAGKNLESGGSFIAYTIRTCVQCPALSSMNLLAEF